MKPGPLKSLPFDQFHLECSPLHRSHSVFILKIHGKNSKTSESCVGSLNLVDLAGSERLKASGSTGARLEETKSINSSLSNLSKVILALANSKVRRIQLQFNINSDRELNSNFRNYDVQIMIKHAVLAFSKDKTCFKNPSS